ncbi:type II toxin-antitoxin system HipA family toxin [Mesorhizobium huakuii]|uniref:Type II toxin-antitoxin system HipA family toxin n=1 Tax=Mesorhizobium huakuii TaxID=28104 RepID=A0A7G6T6I3_9HYPH|nr:type II toxin-antitoxin system HipA family toxin [Mesorhizobium huakuii]QND62365.1 type II toxin-antitoxin system HipA family toxin [Mesorhizobium huakuii]QND69549.1 type II toxin-antitoxin system HipA family toxin [Mesorhizobium loti]
MTHLLDVYFRETKAGILSQDEDGALGYAYYADYLAGQQPRVISFSMPLREEPYADRVARPFFSGLLPDEGARQRLAGALGLSAGNAFGLLEVIGGECAGALSLYPAGEAPAPSDDDEALSAERLKEIIGKLRERPLLGGEEGVRLSLAGAQDKLAVIVEGETIRLAKGGRPTTHILKPVIQALEGTVENELFCLRLAERLQLPVPRVEMRRAGDTAFLLIQRYDRARTDGGHIERLHQEDFCQALSVPPELKYEEEGGPGTKSSLDLIDRACARPAADRLRFIRMLIFHYLVGNADAHGKNYALLYDGDTPNLAPLYDVVCTAAYPRLAKKLAMAIGGRSVPDTIQLKHWLTLVPETRGAQRLLIRDIATMAGRIGDEADALLAQLANVGADHAILKSVRAVIATRATHLLRMTEGG